MGPPRQGWSRVASTLKSLRPMSIRSTGAVILVAAGLLTGCPGSIDDPARFRNVAGQCPSDFDVEADLFRRTCAQLGCHTGGPTLAAAGLDLAAPAVGPRLLAHRSSECGGRPLVDLYHLGDSYLLEKVDEDVPECGERMPDGMEPLNPVERTCLDEYLQALVAAHGGDGAVPPPLDAGTPPPTDGGAARLRVVEAEGMTLDGYEPDAANPSVIRIPDGATTGTATHAFEGPAGAYRVTLHVWAESDGQPELTLRVGGAQIATETYPLATADLEPATLGPFPVELSTGAVIVLEGHATDAAWARIDRMELEP